MDQASRKGIEEGALTAGQRRKLNALKKSVGEEIGERAFAEWLASQGGARTKADANAVLIVDTLWPSMDAPGDASICFGGLVHVVRCCRLSGLFVRHSNAAGPYGDAMIGSTSLGRA